MIRRWFKRLVYVFAAFGAVVAINLWRMLWGKEQ